MLVKHKQVTVADMDDQCFRVSLRGSGTDYICVLWSDRGDNKAEE